MILKALADCRNALFGYQNEILARLLLSIII
jgi:hypothetical protein